MVIKLTNGENQNLNLGSKLMNLLLLLLLLLLFWHLVCLARRIYVVISSLN